MKSAIPLTAHPPYITECDHCGCVLLYQAKITADMSNHTLQSIHVITDVLSKILQTETLTF